MEYNMNDQKKKKRLFSTQLKNKQKQNKKTINWQKAKNRESNHLILNTGEVEAKYVYYKSLKRYKICEYYFQNIWKKK